MASSSIYSLITSKILLRAFKPSEVFNHNTSTVYHISKLIKRQLFHWVSRHWEKSSGKVTEATPADKHSFQYTLLGFTWYDVINMADTGY